MRSKAVRATCLGWRFSTSSTGTRSTRSSATTFWNTGVSRMPSRIHSPIPTMMMLRKNGMRQPQYQELVAGQPAEHQHREIGEKQPRRRAELRPRRDKPAILVGSRPFHRQQHRAAPFAADPDSLDQADDGQQNGAPDADAGVGRHETNRKGGEPGHQQGRDQGRLAADPVALMTEYRSTDRPPDKTDEENAERLQAPRSTASSAGNRACRRPARSPCRKAENRTTRSSCRPCWR